MTYLLSVWKAVSATYSLLFQKQEKLGLMLYENELINHVLKIGFPSCESRPSRMNWDFEVNKRWQKIPVGKL